MGAEKDIIVAVELGSKAIRAVAGKRELDGTMQVLAIAQEEAANAVRKGVVDSIDKATQAISHVVGAINDKLGIYTTRIYVGLSGQSLHTKANAVPCQLSEKTQISNKIIDQLMETNNGVVYTDSRILDVVPQEYHMGPRKVTDPVGIVTSQLEAHYMNVVARDTLSDNIELCVRNAGLELAELLISPICLADALLTSNEKRSGCALVDMGADTTTVLVYTNNILRHLVVIPLGGNNVTADISSKGVETEEAEALKLKYGTANHRDNCNDEKKDNIKLSFGRSISEEELHEIIESRYEEIILNAGFQIHNFNDKLLSGIVITGGASRVKGITEAFAAAVHFDKQIRLFKGFPTNIVLAPSVNISETDNLNTLFALLLKGDQPCAGNIPEEEEVETEPTKATEESHAETTDEEENTAETGETGENGISEDKEQKTKGNMKKKIKRLWETMNRMLTDQEEE